ncbi:MAG: vWA domain-containing protein [Planctomycetales bacterium]
MSAAPVGTVSSAGATRDRSRWLAVPSWMISLLLHAVLLLLCATTIQPPTRIGDPDAGEREVGLYFNSQSAAQDFPGAGDAASAGTANAPADSGLSAGTDATRLDDAPPVALDLPSREETRLGPGSALPQVGAPTDARQLIKSTGTGTGGAGGEPGGGGTTFFGHQAEGTSFVYVLDASGSMGEHNALGAAKAELLASLAQLQPTQQFQVIFYSEKVYPMVGAGGKPQLFWGTDPHRTRASQFVSGIQPLEGTRHLEALLQALSYNPEVIFFLTDAGEPILYPADLERIKKRNGGRTQIHAVEFGKGANLKADNFIKRLARDNGGGYVYRDIQKFGGK